MVLSFGSQRHSFWLWPCVYLMLLCKMPFNKMCLKIIVKQ
ncbi:Tfp pilus assembly protein [Vibrio cholerae]|nr:Tfp pilus assembly protein [Vibrio cholerae]